MTGTHWGLWLVELHGQYIEQWLQSYDPDAYDGRGDACATSDPKLAKRFVNPSAALEEWRRVSTIRPWRSDGQPNRPLSAFTVTPRVLPEEDG